MTKEKREEKEGKGAADYSIYWFPLLLRLRRLYFPSAFFSR
jgi:hypothetical protein